VISHPLAPHLAFEFINEILSQPNVVCVQRGPRHIEIMEDLVIEAQAIGPLLSDAVLAALALEQGATLATTDRDFRRFQGLRLVDPLAA
jgi:predicted nucleic acid-binding protein